MSLQKRYNTTLFYLIFIPLTALFVYGVIHLLILRYERGDIYPPSSSLRADPLGVKAFYEGIEATRSGRAERKYQPITSYTALRDTTLLYIGSNAYDLMMVEPESAEVLDTLIRDGNRLVMTFMPSSAEGGLWEGNDEPDVPEDADEDKEDQNEDNSLQNKPISLAERWGVAFTHTALSRTVENTYAMPADPRRVPDLPERISWHSTLHFTRLDAAWRVLYRRDGLPVLIERQLGEGTIVLSADSYFLSNEAMRDERHPALLTWLLGANARALFDETHFGVMETPGVMSLIRKYHLEWFVLSLIVVALLVVWQQAVSFVPPHDQRKLAIQEADLDAMAGFVNLLRHNISSRQIVATCLEEWNASFQMNAEEKQKLAAQMQAILDAERGRPIKQRDPVACYRRMCELFAGKLSWKML